MKLNSSGIYRIISPSGGTYVGSAINIRLRWHGHKSALRKGTHKNKKLQNAWDKYGEDHMLFCVMLVCSKNDLLLYEQKAIDVLRPRYNLCIQAGSALGLKWSEESKRRKSEGRRGVRLTAQHRANIGAALMGQVVSSETKEKLATQRGWKHTEESKAKMRGRQFSADHRAKLRASHFRET